jgi:hypothetical protein
MKKLWIVPVVVTLLAGGEHKTMSLETMSAIQPGMGTVMMEYGQRFYVLYYAAKAKNWDLAKYELREQLEIQEVGEATRPKYASQLKAFEDAHLTKLEKAIETKDWQRFEAVYTEATKACNRCHVETAHAYIHYRLPSAPPVMLQMNP